MKTIKKSSKYKEITTSITLQVKLNKTNNKDFTTIILAKSLLNCVYKFYYYCFKQSLNKIKIDCVLFYNFEDNKEDNINL